MDWRTARGSATWQSADQKGGRAKGNASWRYKSIANVKIKYPARALTSAHPSSHPQNNHKIQIHHFRIVIWHLLCLLDFPYAYFRLSAFAFSPSPSPNKNPTSESHRSSVLFSTSSSSPSLLCAICDQFSRPIDQSAPK